MNPLEGFEPNWKVVRNMGAGSATSALQEYHAQLMEHLADKYKDSNNEYKDQFPKGGRR